MMMDSGLILHTLLGLLLLAVPAGALYLLEQKMLKSFTVAVVRMVVQLLVMCLVVWALIRVGSTWLLLAWYALIAVFSGWIVMKRCRLGMQGGAAQDAADRHPGLMPTACVAAGLFLGVAFVGLWLLALVLPVRPFDARWFVPVMALLMGHAAAMMIRGITAYASALEADSEQYEFLRGNGRSHLRALLPFLRRALLAVVSPTIANISVLALTSMPLLLVGILVGGMSPINAFVLMLHMTVGCIAASILSLGIAIFLYDRFASRAVKPEARKS